MAKKRSTAATRRPSPTKGKAAGSEGRVLAVADALDALRRLQERSVARGLDALSDEEIEAEIRAVRAKRHLA